MRDYRLPDKLLNCDVRVVRVSGTVSNPFASRLQSLQLRQAEVLSRLLFNIGLEGGMRRARIIMSGTIFRKTDSKFISLMFSSKPLDGDPTSASIPQLFILQIYLKCKALGAFVSLSQ